MEMKDFLENFAEQFDETSLDELTNETVFKDLPEWSSLVALLVIGMVDEVYNITITGEVIRNSSTIEELFNAIKNS